MDNQLTVPVERSPGKHRLCDLQYPDLRITSIPLPRGARQIAGSLLSWIALNRRARIPTLEDRPTDPGDRVPISMVYASLTSQYDTSGRDRAFRQGR